MRCMKLTRESKPSRSVPYRIAPSWRAELKEEIQSLVRDGILVPSKSPWSFPMVPVCKKDTNAIRPLIDYRRLNKVTKADPYQVTMVQELLDNVAGATWLTKLDMNKGFYQLPLDKNSQDKTAFVRHGASLHFRTCLLVQRMRLRHFIIACTQL